jgi:hypothetical protein
MLVLFHTLPIYYRKTCIKKMVYFTKNYDRTKCQESAVLDAALVITSEIRISSMSVT